VTARRSLAFLGTGLVGEVIYLAITVRLPWLRYGGRLQSWSHILGQDGRTFIICLAAITLLLAAYLWGWCMVRSGAVPRWMVWGGALLYALTLLWLLPITADLFIYLSQAHMLTDLGANPLQVAIVDSPTDPLLAAYVIRYGYQPSVYGPAWVLLAAVGTLGKFDVSGGLFYFKVLAAAAYLGCGWLLERKEIRPAASLEGLYLFAWNPLVLLMAVGDGHNDIVMMALVLLAGWWLLRERWLLAFGALAFSVAIKYVSVILLPLFVAYLWWRLVAQGKHRWLVLVRAGLVVVGVWGVTMAPFWSPDLVHGMVERLVQPVNSAVPGLSRWVLGVGLVLFTVFYAVILRQMGRGPSSFSKLMGLSFVVTFLAFVLGAARSQPWHLIWPTTLAGLSKRRWAWPVVIAGAALMLVGQVWVEWGTPGLDRLF
jgi:hypothetical protein